MFNTTTPQHDGDATLGDDAGEPTEPTPRRSIVWRCPECDTGIVLHVRVDHAPICNNKSAHSRRHIDMKKEKKGPRQ